MSKLAQAGDKSTTSGFSSIPLSIALCIVSSFIMFANPFAFKFSSNLSVASPIRITVLICSFTDLQNSDKSVFLSRPPAIKTTSVLLNESIATIAASGFVALESL